MYSQFPRGFQKVAFTKREKSPLGNVKPKGFPVGKVKQAPQRKVVGHTPSGKPLYSKEEQEKYQKRNERLAVAAGTALLASATLGPYISARSWSMPKRNTRWYKGHGWQHNAYAPRKPSVNPGKIIPGIDKVKTKREATQLYREQAKLYHPDRQGGDHSKMQAINAAFSDFKQTAGYNKLAMVHWANLVSALVR